MSKAKILSFSLIVILLLLSGCSPKVKADGEQSDKFMNMTETGIWDNNENLAIIKLTSGFPYYDVDEVAMTRFQNWIIDNPDKTVISISSINNGPYGSQQAWLIYYQPLLK